MVRLKNSIKQFLKMNATFNYLTIRVNMKSKTFELIILRVEVVN